MKCEHFRNNSEVCFRLHSVLMVRGWQPQLQRVLRCYGIRRPDRRFDSHTVTSAQSKVLASTLVVQLLRRRERTES